MEGIVCSEHQMFAINPNVEDFATFSLSSTKLYGSSRSPVLESVAEGIEQDKTWIFFYDTIQIFN